MAAAGNCPKSWMLSAGQIPRPGSVLSAISLETLHAAMAELKTPEVTQISVSRSKPAGELHLLLAQNPVFLITGALA